MFGVGSMKILCVCMCVCAAYTMNTDDITIFMRELRSAETKCPSCNEKKHTKECDFGDFSVVDILCELYVHPVIGLSTDLQNKIIEFLAQRATRPKYLDGVCYILTNDIIYKYLGTDESEMVQVFVKSINNVWVWISVNIFLRKNPVLRDTKDEALPTKIGKLLKALDLFVKIKSGAVGRYDTTAVSDRQKMIATFMMLYLQRISLRL